jgi:hypothetical protein
MQEWTEEAIKRTILVGDAPAHGFYDNLYDDRGDNYPDGAPDVITLEKITKEFKAKEIDLQIVKLDKYMDPMI